jgi:hypothetical protein
MPAVDDAQQALDRTAVRALKSGTFSTQAHCDTRDMPSMWGVTPRVSVERECARAGTMTVVSMCIVLLSGVVVDAFLFAIGGPGAHEVLEGRGGGQRRVLAAGLGSPCILVCTGRSGLPGRDRRAFRPCLAGAGDGREGCCAARLDDALEAIGSLLSDPVARVRAAAARAQKQLTVEAS